MTFKGSRVYSEPVLAQMLCSVVSRRRVTVVNQDGNSPRWSAEGLKRLLHVTERLSPSWTIAIRGRRGGGSAYDTDM